MTDRRRWTSRSLFALVASVLAVAGLTACGSDDDKAAAGAQPSGAAAEQLTPMKLAITAQVVNAGPYVLGVEKGIFKKHGIDLKLEPATESATLIPSLMSGEVDAAQTSYPGTAAAVLGGLPIVAAAPSDKGPPTEAESAKDPQQIVALKKAGVSSVQDLAGKRVAIATLGGGSELMVRAAESKAGLKQGSIKAVPIPPASQAAAMRGGDVVAAMITGSQLTELEQSEDVVRIVSGLWSVMPNAPGAVINMTQKLVSEKPDLVRKFQLGNAEATEYAAAHPDEVKQALTTWTEITPEVLKAMDLPFYPTKASPLAPDAPQKMADMMVEFGMLKEKVDMSKVVIPYPLPA